MRTFNARLPFAVAFVSRFGAHTLTSWSWSAAAHPPFALGSTTPCHPPDLASELNLKVTVSRNAVVRLRSLAAGSPVDEYRAPFRPPTFSGRSVPSSLL